MLYIHTFLGKLVSLTTQTSAHVAKYDIAGHDEVLFACIFFFQDFNLTRDILREAWKDYRNGIDSLMAVSLITNTAIELIQRAASELLEEINNSRHEDAPDEENLIHWVYCHVAKNTEDLEDEEDIINMANHYEADIFCKTASLFVEEWVETTSWKQLSFCGSNEDAGIGLDAHYDDLNARDQIFQDRIFSQILLSHLHNLTIFKMQMPTAIDDITRAIRSIEESEKKTIPLWFNLAFQILLDIRHVLGTKSSNAFTELQHSGSEISLNMKKYFEFSRGITGKSKIWHAHNDPQLTLLTKFNDEWLQKDLIAFAIKKQAKQKVADSVFDRMCPPYFLLKNHPLLCGLMQYWMHHSYRQVQICFTNCYDSILACAHLYNAAKQSGLFAGEWPGMDQVIFIHGAQRLFVGSTPTNPRDFFIRFQMVLGTSAVNFAGKTRAITDGRRQPIESIKAAGSRRLRKTLPIHDIFEGRYTRLEKRADLSIGKIDALLASMKPTINEKGKHSYLVKYAEGWVSQRKLPSNELLMVLGAALSENIPELHFDYLSLHIDCANFLSSLRIYFINNADNGFDSLYNIVSREDASSALEFRLIQPSLAMILKESMMIDDKSMALRLVSCILMEHPDAAKAGEALDRNAKTWSNILSYSNVNLKVASDSLQAFLDSETGRRSI